MDGLASALHNLSHADPGTEFGQEDARLHALPPCAPASQNDAALADLREQVDKFDALAEPGASPPLNRMVAEFGLRSFETLRDWALWALEHLGENTASAQ